MDLQFTSSKYFNNAHAGILSEIIGLRLLKCIYFQVFSVILQILDKNWEPCFVQRLLNAVYR